jgi:hypothetical protein
MPRRNQGPKLRWLAKRGCYYITWTEQGRSRERSAGTADREKAEAVFASGFTPEAAETVRVIPLKSL